MNRASILGALVVAAVGCQSSERAGTESKHARLSPARISRTSTRLPQSSFHAYDTRFVEEVERRWRNRLDEGKVKTYPDGHVVTQFHLNHTGEVGGFRIVEDTVGNPWTDYCREAVLAPKPYPSWPREMRLAVGKDHREIKFTFYYYHTNAPSYEPKTKP